MADVSVTVNNFSDDVWTRNNWNVGAGSDPDTNWTDQVSSTPSATLAATDGTTMGEASSEILSGIVQDALTLTLGYISPHGDEFAVSVVRRFHLFSVIAQLGPGCEWQTWDNSAWSGWTEDTSAKTWTFPKYRVIATPTLTNETASVEIDIQNLGD